MTNGQKMTLSRFRKMGYAPAISPDGKDLIVRMDRKLDQRAMRSDGHISPFFVRVTERGDIRRDR